LKQLVTNSKRPSSLFNNYIKDISISVIKQQAKI